MRIPDGGSILNHWSDIGFVGWVSDAVTAWSEVTVQESSSAIRFRSNRIDVVIDIQFGFHGDTEVLGGVNQFSRLAGRGSCKMPNPNSNQIPIPHLYSANSHFTRFLNMHLPKFPRQFSIACLFTFSQRMYINDKFGRTNYWQKPTTNKLRQKDWQWQWQNFCRQFRRV